MNDARWIVAFVALYSCGEFVADALVPSTSRQHLWNPAWPPHAKFHNGQSMLLGILSGALALVVLFGFGPLKLPLLGIATASVSMYWVSMVLSPLFPGTAWYDPEFQDTSPRPYGFSPQQLLSYFLCLLLIVAVVLVVRFQESA